MYTRKNFQHIYHLIRKRKSIYKAIRELEDIDWGVLEDCVIHTSVEALTWQAEKLTTALMLQKDYNPELYEKAMSIEYTGTYRFIRWNVPYLRADKTDPYSSGTWVHKYQRFYKEVPYSDIPIPMNWADLLPFNLRPYPYCIPF